MLCDGKCVDTLRVTHTELSSIIEGLERATGSSSRTERRKHPRYRYLVREGLALQIEGANADFLVRPRNISAQGISFLHGSFLYAGTPCALKLKTTEGGKVRATGKVVHCRCVHGRIHEVGFKFDRRIEIEDFVTPDELVAHESSPVPEASPPVPYPAADIIAAARQLQELASSGAPHEQLQGILERLTTLLTPPPALSA